jgi:hypothetical protein
VQRIGLKLVQIIGLRQCSFKEHKETKPNNP